MIFPEITPQANPLSHKIVSEILSIDRTLVLIQKMPCHDPTPYEQLPIQLLGVNVDLNFQAMVAMVTTTSQDLSPSGETF